MRPGRDDRQESTTSCDDVTQVRRWSPSCVLRRPWRTKQVHEVDQTSHPTPRHSFIALSLPRSAQCPCNRKGGEEEKRRSLTSLQTCHTHTPPGGVQRQSQTVHSIQFQLLRRSNECSQRSPWSDLPRRLKRLPRSINWCTI